MTNPPPPSLKLWLHHCYLESKLMGEKAVLFPYFLLSSDFSTEILF